MTIKHLILFLLFATSGCLLSAQDNTKELVQNLDDGLALKGYDLVSYYSGTPVKGKKSITKQYKGATYRFINERNLEAFNENPEKYLPAYGGYCAYAMGTKGNLVGVNPKSYKILDNKLYLFYNAFFINTLNKWNKDEANLLQEADVNWENY